MSWFAGNISFAKLLAQPSHWGSNSSLAAILIAVILSIAFWPSSDDKIHKLEGFHLVTLAKFFYKRYDFFQGNFKKTGLKMFRFNVLQHRVIAISGEAHRKIFFGDRNLGLSQGYTILTGGIPRLKDIHNYDPSDIPEQTKRFMLLFRRERINEVFPLLLEDVNRRMEDWGSEGKINPFNEVYDLVFQMTVRLASCRELSEDREVVARVSKNYWEIEKNGSLVTVLFPWFPSFAKRAKDKATKALYNTFLSYIDLRRKSSTPSNDPIDLFISHGISDDHIIEVRPS